MWVDPTSSDDDVRYLFLAGTSVNGTEINFNGLPIIEVLRSRTSSPSDGFDFLSTFSSDGLQMCDPELVTFGNISLVYVCTNEYLVGKYYYTDFEVERAKRASLDEDENTREVREMAADIVATFTTKLTLFHSIILTRSTLLLLH